MIKCQIKWIDSEGNSTADENPADRIVSCDVKIADGQVERKFYYCCKEHAEKARQYSNWTVHNPLEVLNKLNDMGSALNKVAPDFSFYQVSLYHPLG